MIVKYFPEAQRISCYFHYKQSLERNAKKMGLAKKKFIKATREVINKLSVLPLIYDGKIDTVTNTIDELKSKYTDHFRYIDSFYNENMKYFINNSLYYSKYPKLVRSNSILENYNKQIKEYLGNKKIVNYLNFLSFIKKEVEKYFKEFNIKSRNYLEILKYKNIHKNSLSDINLENSIEDIISEKTENSISYEIDYKEMENISYHSKGKWLKWVNNSCRFDVIMTIYLFIFYPDNEKIYPNLNNEGIKILHESIRTLIDNPLSDDRFNFWSYVNLNQLDRGENPLNFGEIGFISGIFKIFDNNKKYCLQIKQKKYLLFMSKKL